MTHVTLAGDEAAAELIERICGTLEGRVARCFDRLEDAVSELHALHCVDAEEILARVHMTLAAEQPQD